MKPASFDYYRPQTVEEAVGLLAEMGDDAKVIAGGQSLVPMLNMRLTRYSALVDLEDISSLQRVTAGSDALTIGAMVRYCEIEEDERVGEMAPMLSKATPLIGHFQIRSRGTLGGAIAHADPAAEYPAVALALGAEMELVGPAGRRLVRSAEFFTGTWTTVAEAAEIVTAVRFPSWGSRSGFAVEEVARRHGDFALAGACVAITLVGDAVGRTAISLFGLASTPIRADVAENALAGLPLSEIDAREVGQLAMTDVEPPGDLHASSALRAKIGAEVVSRAILRAMEEASVSS